MIPKVEFLQKFSSVEDRWSLLFEAAYRERTHTHKIQQTTLAAKPARNVVHMLREYTLDWN